MFGPTDSHPHVFCCLFSKMQHDHGLNFLKGARDAGTLALTLALMTLCIFSYSSLPQRHSTRYHSILTSNTHYCAVTHLLHLTSSIEDVDNVYSYLCMVLCSLPSNLRHFCELYHHLIPDLSWIPDIVNQCQFKNYTSI